MNVLTDPTVVVPAQREPRVGGERARWRLERHGCSPLELEGFRLRPHVRSHESAASIARPAEAWLRPPAVGPASSSSDCEAGPSSTAGERASIQLDATWWTISCTDGSDGGCRVLLLEPWRPRSARPESRRTAGLLARVAASSAVLELARALRRVARRASSSALNSASRLVLVPDARSRRRTSDVLDGAPGQLAPSLEESARLRSTWSASASSRRRSPSGIRDLAERDQPDDLAARRAPREPLDVLLAMEPVPACVPLPTGSASADARRGWSVRTVESRALSKLADHPELRRQLADRPHA